MKQEMSPPLKILQATNCAPISDPPGSSLYTRQAMPWCHWLANHKSQRGDALLLANHTRLSVKVCVA